MGLPTRLCKEYFQHANTRFQRKTPYLCPPSLCPVSYSVLAAHLLFAAAGVSVGDEKLDQQNDDGLFYADDKNDYYLHYQPDLAFLSSDAAILKQEHAKRIRDASRQNAKKAIVYAAGNYMGQRELTKMGITFCQLPYVLHEK